MNKIALIFILIIQSLSIFADENCTPQSPTNSLNLPENLNIEDAINTNFGGLNSGGLFAESGGWSGNGGDFNEVSDNIWFLGNDKINYCIKSSKTFPLANSEQQELVEKSIAKWKSFYKKYDLFNSLTKMPFRRRPVTISFPDKTPRSINFNFEFNNNCKNAKLIFFFGIENKVIARYKEFEAEHPYGFALRKSYDHKTYSNQGLIWIKEIQDVDKIEHTLLHEIGHVLGMKHDSVYIMRSVMAQELEDNSKRVKIYNKIETTAWPYRFKDGSSIFLTLPTRKGPRRARKQCSVPNSFVAGRELPQISSLIRAKADHCLMFKLTANKGSRIKALQLKLQIINLSTGKAKTISGRFLSERKSLRKRKGPGVFTKFLIHRPNGKVRSVWRKAFLDQEVNNEISGSFRSRFTSLPAKLTQEKGAVLDIYIAKTDRWITLKSYHDL